MVTANVYDMLNEDMGMYVDSSA